MCNSVGGNILFSTKFCIWMIPMLFIIPNSQPFPAIFPDGCAWPMESSSKSQYNCWQIDGISCPIDFISSTHANKNKKHHIYRSLLCILVGEHTYI